MFNILSLITTKKRKSSSGWISFNAPCCHNRGHRQDKKLRGGIKLENQNWRYHCFNCNYTCNFTLGQSISKKTRDFLTWCGANEQQIQKWNFWSLGFRSVFQEQEQSLKNTSVKFVEVKLPSGATPLPHDDYSDVYDYLKKRMVLRSSKYYVTPSDPMIRNRNRVIIPFTYANKIVGYTSRYFDERTPKYINEMPTGYVYGIDNQKKNWQICILVEGIFDALAIDGCAYLHNTISKEQSAIVNSLNRRVIVVPDQDQAGLTVCNRALQLGYQVSLPHWHSDVKDVNDAVQRYGKLPTLMSIVQSATHSDILIKLRIKEIENRSKK